MTKWTQVTNRITVRSIVLASAILLIGMATAAPAQQTLGDLVREGGFEWLLGRWTATLGEEAKAQLVYQWKIKDHLMTVDFKAGDYAYHGMIFISPEDGEVVEIGMDSKGVYAKGVWGPDGMDAVSTSTRTDPQGNTERFAIVHSEVDGKTMRLTLHQVDENGTRAEQASVVMEYKRGAAKAAGKTPKEAMDKTEKKKGTPRKSLKIGAKVGK